MSFIFGIVDFNSDHRSLDDIQQLGDAVAWEGFEQEVVYQNNGIYLGFSFHPNRTNTASFYEDESYVVLSEGRIFNHDKLLKSLSYTSDASCFLAAHYTWGKAAANYVNGEFSVVLINKKTRQVDFYRDHVGVRGLAYYYDKETFVFASHPYGIAKSKLVNFQYNVPYFLARFFRFRGTYVLTYFDTIHRVLPGHHFSANASEVVQKDYWNPTEIARKNQSRSEVVHKLRDSVQNAVKQRLKGEKKIGTHVSGGLDSCGVASLVAQSIVDQTQQITGYSWSPLKSESKTIQQKDDEYAYIEQVSNATKIPVHFVTNSPREFTESTLLPEFETMSIEHPIMQQAQKDGVSILFSGFGGDEFLSLSNRGMINHLFFTFQWWTLLNLFLKGKYKMIFTKFSLEVTPEFKWNSKKALKKLLKENEMYFKKNFLTSYLPYLKSRLKSPIYSKDRPTFISNLISNYHITNRLDAWSYFGEKYGISYTYPLLDKELLDGWFSMPIEYTYDLETSRKLFRDVFEGILIDEVRLRNSKAEHERVSFTMNNRIEDRDFILSELKKMDKIPELDFINLSQLFNELTAKNDKKTTRDQFIVIMRTLYYQREYKMLKKYY